MSDKKNKRILLVEDDQFIRDIYVEILKDEGYNIDVAVNGEEGYAKMSEGGYDLVLLDIIMPKMDAMAVLEKLQEYPPKFENKHIIFLTNLGQESVVKNGSKFGVDNFLIKSDLTPDQFLKEIAKYLNKD